MLCVSEDTRVPDAITLAGAAGCCEEGVARFWIFRLPAIHSTGRRAMEREVVLLSKLPHRRPKIILYSTSVRRQRKSVCLRPRKREVVFGRRAERLHQRPDALGDTWSCKEEFCVDVHRST